MNDSVLSTASHVYQRILAFLVSFSCGAAGWVIGITAILTLALGYYVDTHLKLDTDTINMLDPELPFRIHHTEFVKHFPQLNDLLVVVIDAPTGSQARETADTLATQLRQHAAAFRSIYQPGQGPFFSRNGFLYVNSEELEDIEARLTEAEPFLGALSHDPSLRGLFNLLSRSLDRPLTAEQRTLLVPLLQSISQALDALFANQPGSTLWEEDLLGRPGSSPGVHRAFILIQPQLDFTSLQAGEDAIALVRQLADTLKAKSPEDVHIRLTGSVAMEDDELGSSLQGAAYATLVSFGLVWLLLLFSLRSFRLVLAILLTLCIGLIWTTAFALGAIGSLNIISITFPVLYIGLGVDFGIQFAMRYREELLKNPNQAASLHQTVTGIGGALTLAAITAGVSFFSFAFTSYQGLAEMGAIAGSGMFIALLLNLTVLPAFLTVMSIQLSAPSSAPCMLSIWHRGIVRHRSLVLWASALAALGSLWLIPHLRFDFNPLHLKDPNTESVSTFQDLLQDVQQPPYTISVLADTLKEAEALSKRLEALPEVEKTIMVTSFIPDNQEERLMKIEDMNLVLYPLTISTSPAQPPQLEDQLQALDTFLAKLRETKTTDDAWGVALRHLQSQLERIQQHKGWPDTVVPDLEKRLLHGLPSMLHQLGELLSTTGVTFDDLPKDLSERYLSKEGRVRIQVFPQHPLTDNETLRQFVRAVQEVAPDAADAPVLMVEVGEAIVTACLQATLYTLLASVVILLVVLGNLRDTILVLLPLGLATLLTLAGAYLLNVPLNLANVIALPLLLGLGLAFGIYLILRSREGTTLEDLFHSHTPRAVLLSALTTIVSFGTLAVSGHQGIASIGLLLTLALSCAIICTLIVLPATLSYCYQAKR